MMKRVSTLFVSVLLLALASSLQASTLTPGLYQLLDHPDSALTDLPVVSYGLRLDALGGTAAERTFSAEQDGAFVTLDWDGSTAVISGAFSNNATNELWKIEYTLSPTTSVADGFQVSEMGGSGSGSITNGYDEYFLTGESAGGIIFSALADGHRLAGDDETPVARGWLGVDTEGYGYYDYSGSNDFLVQLTPVPLPAALPLLLTGVIGFSVFSRRKSVS